ncbi:hypothetical protein EJ08DRAFT_675008 [Tothia fuscella]|uniref:DNA mismatch repair protein S5 domain-containing protein n=1 Tax=Tothia fuscella TaxID=1048955 RepID=A0A9P4P1P9_9PEZI|nr:hypothetical protein EJ08DRAFT_675008 [Tothia fuscella]
MSTSSIKSLPPATVQLIGSTQVLLDASSVIKELVENSIDARATSISIEISTNTLDVIQVRDNGHAIAPDDRSVVCKRYTTSKICDFADVRDLGGSWLGFRGEALSSLAEMSRGLSVVTRVEGEGVAVKMEVGRGGDVVGRSTASHPVGTTVRATDIFHNLPVHKQTALKAVPKTMARIKRLLQAYALARPATRISMRVLKAKNDKGNFLYAPNSVGGTVEDAVFKVVGKECASQCEWSVLEANGFQLQAFLPTVAANAAKIGNIGSFLSIDSRPVSGARGTLKQIVSLFKTKLRASGKQFEGVKDPFLYLNINCPTASYDPNVEPAKDDVIFDDDKKLLSVVAELLDLVYPAPAPEADLEPAMVVSVNSTPAQLSLKAVHPFTTQLLEDSGQSSALATSHKQQTPQLFLENDEGALIEERAAASAWKTNMYGFDEEDLLVPPEDEARPTSAESESASVVGRDVQLSNPWTMARMNAPVRATPFGVPTMTGAEPSQDPTRTHGVVLNRPLMESEDFEDDLHEPIMQQRSSNQSTPINIPNFSQHGLPTPNPSSSPVRGTRLDDIPDLTLRCKKQLGVRPNAKDNTPAVRQNNDSNWFDFGQSSASSQRLKPRNEEARTDQDIRDVFGGAKRRRTAQAQLVTQGDPEEVTEAMRSVLEEDDMLMGPGEVVSDNGPLSKTNEEVIRSNSSRRRTISDNTIVEQPLKRRRTTTGRSRLPLERVARGAQTQNLILTIAVTTGDIANAVSKVDGDTNLIDWDGGPVGMCAFFAAPSATEMNVWSKRIVRGLRMAGGLVEGVVEAEDMVARLVDVMKGVKWY